MSRRIDIELTSARDDGKWTWRAAGARQPKGTITTDILPAGASVGDILRVEIEAYLDGMEVVAVLPPRAPRREPERLELRPQQRNDAPLVTSAVVGKRGKGRSRDQERRGREQDGRRRERDRDGTARRDEPRRRRDAGRERRERRDDAEARGPRGRGEGRAERRRRPPREPAEAKPKAKRLRAGRAHRSQLLESLPAEQRPIAEQLLAGGIPAVRQAIDKQNEALRAEGKPEVKSDSLLRVAEDLRPKVSAALWRDRAEAAAAAIDDIDLRDLRSVVNAADDAGRDKEARALAAQLREALAGRVEKEHSAWLAELTETVRDGRVVRALRLSSRPPKAGAPIPPELATELANAASAALTAETTPERWETVLDALAFSPVRRRVVPQSLPTTLPAHLRETIARLGSRLPDIAHIFAVEPKEPTAKGTPRRRGKSPSAPRGATAKRRRDPATEPPAPSTDNGAAATEAQVDASTATTDTAADETAAEGSADATAGGTDEPADADGATAEATDTGADADDVATAAAADTDADEATAEDADAAETTADDTDGPADADGATAEATDTGADADDVATATAGDTDTDVDEGGRDSSAAGEVSDADGSLSGDDTDESRARESLPAGQGSPNATAD